MIVGSFPMGRFFISGVNDKIVMLILLPFSINSWSVKLRASSSSGFKSSKSTSPTNDSVSMRRNDGGDYINRKGGGGGTRLGPRTLLVERKYNIKIKKNETNLNFELKAEGFGPEDAENYLKDFMKSINFENLNPTIMAKVARFDFEYYQPARNKLLDENISIEFYQNIYEHLNEFIKSIITKEKQGADDEIVYARLYSTFLSYHLHLLSLKGQRTL